MLVTHQLGQFLVGFIRCPCFPREGGCSRTAIARVVVPDLLDDRLLLVCPNNLFLGAETGSFRRKTKSLRKAGRGRFGDFLRKIEARDRRMCRP